ncbi:hypothetical protein TTHERM_00835380 (macronuclear) [Tetrahymena thermophila SB210]|uniref:Uncharacterized protein n=1 Tax=Tetrahymena thermophila (strain SB210) TaxID=312017 RepID=Q22E90_TETTS|nr:hypothetical protein TTHERM_00835380 [Tetrahymena thermophila SB210]EAR83638.2 hypothetical protein TTHERM_00835380 [Tetrahymena thermophila SB210]|eukprot:XP_001031301.2 hypothetical protein TTHERM_00835380 [Tetrahymena thermophila SB210]
MDQNILQDYLKKLKNNISLFKQKQLVKFKDQRNNQNLEKRKIPQENRYQILFQLIKFTGKWLKDEETLEHNKDIHNIINKPNEADNSSTNNVQTNSQTNTTSSSTLNQVPNNLNAGQGQILLPPCEVQNTWWSGAGQRKFKNKQTNK